MSKLLQYTLFKSPPPKASFSLYNRYLNNSRASSFWPRKSSFSTSASIHLPVLDALVKRILANSNTLLLKRTAIVYIHHALYSSLPVLRANFELGVSPQNTFVLDKHYSECKEVVAKTIGLGVHYQSCSAQIGLGKFSHSFTRDINYLWYKVMNDLKSKKGNTVDNLIIMDHGGHALAFIPAPILEDFNVIGIEKTTAGLINPNTMGLPFPIIEVASCAAKKILESPFIAEAVVEKLSPLIPIKNNNLTCGVVGCGAIGKAVANKLLAMGHKVIVYDQDVNQLKGIKGAIITNELASVIAFADYIFGCSGQDITKSIDFIRLSPKDKTFISCSSEDKEFLSLLQLVQCKHNGKVAATPLNDIEYKNEMGAIIHILRGGFPINFDESGESVSPQKIQLTRALVLAGVLQALEFFKKPLLREGGNYMLDPKSQKFIVEECIKHRIFDNFSKKVIDNFQDERWIAENSGGFHESCDIFNEEPKITTALKVG